MALIRVILPLKEGQFAFHLVNCFLSLSTTVSQNTLLIGDPTNGNPKYLVDHPFLKHPSRLATCVHPDAVNPNLNK